MTPIEQARRVLLGEAPYACILGDGFALAREMGDGAVDHIIGDPPYDEKTHKGARNGFAKRHAIKFAPLPPTDSFLPELLRVSKRWTILFCAMEQIGEYKRTAAGAWIRSGFWYRPDGTPQFGGDRPAQPGEGVAIMHRQRKMAWNNHGHKAYWSCPIERMDRHHETQKPLRLMLQIVEQFTSHGDIVFDPTCGFATTGVACLRLGRRFIGCEIDPEKHANASDRLSAEGVGLTLTDARAGQGSLFDISKPKIEAA